MHLFVSVALPQSDVYSIQIHLEMLYLFKAAIARLHLVCCLVSDSDSGAVMPVGAGRVTPIALGPRKGAWPVICVFSGHARGVAIICELPIDLCLTCDLAILISNPYRNQDTQGK